MGIAISASDSKNEVQVDITPSYTPMGFDYGEGARQAEDKNYFLQEPWINVQYNRNPRFVIGSNGGYLQYEEADLYGPLVLTDIRATQNYKEVEWRVSFQKGSTNFEVEMRSEKSVPRNAVIRHIEGKIINFCREQGIDEGQAIQDLRVNFEGQKIDWKYNPEEQFLNRHKDRLARNPDDGATATIVKHLEKKKEPEIDWGDDFEVSI